MDEQLVSILDLLPSGNGDPLALLEEADAAAVEEVENNGGDLLSEIRFHRMEVLR